MENMEEKIMDVLGDPEKLEQIMNIAKGLGFSPANEPPTPESELPSGSSVFNLLQHVAVPGGQRDTLLNALMPFLKPDKQRKLQRAMKVAKLSTLAEYALKNYADQI